MNDLKTVLVTGGTGFVGAYIIKQLLENGYRVRAIRRNSTLPFYIEKEIFEKVEWVPGDVLDIVSLEEAMQGVDTVIHSAAIISFFKKERAHMYQVNVSGTANVVNLALELNVSRLVHISSISALGRTANGEQVNEEKKWAESKLNTHYGISKYKAEMEVWRAMGEGLNAVIVNPSTVLGFGNWNSGSCAIFKNIYHEFPYYTTGVNGFVDVEDVAKAVVMLMESGLRDERFILNSENKEFREIFYSIADSFKKKRPSKAATAFLSNMAWRLEKIKSLITGKKPLLTRETARIALSKTYWQNGKILEALPGFTFSPIDTIIHAACKKYEASASSLKQNL